MENFTIVNEPTKKTSEYTKEKLIKLQKETDKSKFLLGGFKFSLSIINKTNGQKISVDAEDINNIPPTNLTQLAFITHPKTTKYTFAFDKLTWKD